ncbi:MAG: hypothetical protein ACYST6_11220 [Planctomycetota bacterium]|jgi:hypothetical protein
MRKEIVLGVLFFSGIWGLCEAVLGGALYAAAVPHASVVLTACGLVILSFAGVYFPHKGIPSAIAGCAMLYKFLNEPFFACHLVGILLTGLCYDLVFNVLKARNRAVAAAGTVYVSYALFALLMTYIIRYEHWAQAGAGKVLNHVLVSGSIAALACALLVPLAYRIGGRLKKGYSMPFAPSRRLVPSGVLLAAAGLWVFGMAAYLFS